MNLRWLKMSWILAPIGGLLLLLSTNIGLTNVLQWLGKFYGLPVEITGLYNQFPKQISISKIIIATTQHPMVLNHTTIKLNHLNLWHKIGWLNQLHTQSLNTVTPIVPGMPNIVVKNINLATKKSKYQATFMLPQLAINGHAHWSSHLPTKLTVQLTALGADKNVLNAAFNYDHNQNWHISFAAKNWQFQLPSLHIRAYLSGQCQYQQQQQKHTGQCQALQGQVNRHPFTAKFTARGTKQQQSLQAKFDMLNTHINTHITRKAQHTHATWQIHAPNIGQFVPNWDGMVQGHGDWHQTKKQTLWSGHYQLQKINTPFFKTKQMHIRIKPKQANRIDIQSDQLQYLGQIIHNLHIQLQRSSTQTPYPKRIRAQATTAIGQLSLLGMLTQHDMTLTNFNLRSKSYGQWQLKNPSTFSYQPKQLSLSDTCLTQSRAILCFSGTQSTTHTKIYGQAKHWPIAMVTPLLPAPLKHLKGHLFGHWQLEQNQQQAWLGSAQLTLNNGQFIMPFSEQPIHHLHSQINIKRTENATPIAQIYANGLTDTGSAKLTGLFYLKKGFPGHLNLTGHHLHILQSAAIKLAGTPNLTLTHKAGATHIQGEIALDQVQIKPEYFQKSLPENTVIIGEPNHTPRTTTPLSGHIHLGIPTPLPTTLDSITGGLVGQIDLHLTKGQPIIANGKLALTHPKHQFLKALQISKAALYFIHSTLTQPHIALNVSRVLSESWQAADPFSIVQVNVGVRVYGPIQHPNYQYFSSPILMNKTEIISSLISGHQTNIIMPYQAALFSVGLTAKPNDFLQVVNPLSTLSGFGLIDSVQLITNDQLSNQANTSPMDNTSILLTKNISPRLKLNYQFGLLEDNYQLSLNAKLKRNTYSQLYLNDQSAGINLIKVWP